MTVSKSKPWRRDKAPHDVFVEVMPRRGHGYKILVAKAVWGDPTKGILPHWELENGTVLFHASAFQLWRPK